MNNIQANLMRGGCNTMRFILHILISTLILMVCQVCKENSAEGKDLKTFHSQEIEGISYSIDYSPNWEVRQISPNMVGFLSPDNIKVSITIAMQDIRDWGYTSLELDKYIEIYDKNILNYVLDYERLERAKTRIADQDSYLTIYTYTDKFDTDWNVKSKLYTFVVDGMFAYDVGYSSTPELYDKYLSEADNMIKSFKLHRLSGNKWKTYTNQNFKFSINIPQNWDILVVPVNLINMMTNYRGESSIVTFSVSDSVGNTTKNVTVYRKDLRDEPLDLDIYMKEFDISTTKALPDYKVLERGKTRFADQEACFTVYTTNNSKFRTYTFFVDKTVYTLQYTTDIEEYDRSFLEAEKIMRSFKY